MSFRRSAYLLEIIKRLNEAKLTTLLTLAACLSFPAITLAEDLSTHPGKELYQIRGCLGCHGFKGEKEMLDTPNLAGQSKTYMQAQIRFLKEGRRTGLSNAMGFHAATGMAAALDYISNEDMEQIVDYLSKLPTTPPVPLAKPLTFEQTVEARQIYQRIGCEACHGINGRTPANPEYPVIAGQTNTYLRRQLRNFRDAGRTSGHSEIMQKNMRELTNEQIDHLADYISQF